MSYHLGGLGQASAFDTGSAAADALIANANAQLARLLAPAGPAIDASPLPADEKALLKSQPVTFYLQLFGSFENLAAEIINRATVLSGKSTRVIGIPGLNQMTVSMNPDQDPLVPSVTGRHLVRVLRIADLFMVLVYQDPVNLARATVDVFTKYGIQGAAFVGNFVQAAGQQAVAHANALIQQAQQAATTATQQAQQTGQNVKQAVTSAVQTVVDNLPPLPSPPRLFGLGGLGVADGGATPAAAAAGATGATVAGATTGVASTPPLALLIAGLLNALAGAATGAAQGLVPGRPNQPPPPPPGSGFNIPGLPASLQPYVLPVAGLVVAGLVLSALASQKS